MVKLILEEVHGEAVVRLEHDEGTDQPASNLYILAAAFRHALMNDVGELRPLISTWVASQAEESQALDQMVWTDEGSETLVQ